MKTRQARRPSGGLASPLCPELPLPDPSALQAHAHQLFSPSFLCQVISNIPWALRDRVLSVEIMFLSLLFFVVKRLGSFLSLIDRMQAGEVPDVTPLQFSPQAFYKRLRELSHVVFLQLLEEKIISHNNFFELASQPFANSQVYADYLKKKKVPVISLEQLRKKGVVKTLKRILKASNMPAIFWGIDMDSVRSSDAPGVSASYPTGLTAEEILSIAAIAGNDKRSRILEISEVNPKYDIDGRTCKLAAMIMACFFDSQLKRSLGP